MPDLGDIDDRSGVLEKFSQFHLNPNCSDLLLLIGNEKLIAHRFVLSVHSEFFQVLLFGQNFFETNQQEIKIDASPKIFKLLMQYMYTGMLDIRNQHLLDVADLLELAHRYGLIKLEQRIVDYLCVAVDAENACGVLEIAALVEAEILEKRCWIYVDAIIEGIYDVKLNLNIQMAKKLMEKRKIITEAKLFRAIHELTQDKNFCTEEEKKDLLSKIDFNRMTITELMNIVRPTRALDSDTMLDKICENSGQIKKFSSIQSAVKVSAATNNHYFLLKGEQFTSSNAISIDLGALYRFNHLQFLLNPKHTYSYAVDVSRDNCKWDCIADYGDSSCCNFQSIYFPECIAQYLCIYRKRTDVCKTLHCNSFEVNFVSYPPRFCSGCVFPFKNVVTSGRASVFTKYGKYLRVIVPKPQLLSKNHEETGTGIPYTAQKNENGSLIVQLNQPYIINSCRICLWDLDERKYSFKIETTLDQKIYEVIFDKSSDYVSGWQNIKFSARPVKEFKITGIKSTIGDELRLSHFEAPAKALSD